MMKAAHYKRSGFFVLMNRSHSFFKVVLMASRVFFVVFLLFSVSASAATPKEVYWEDLVPEGFNNLTLPLLNHNNAMAQAQPNAPVIEELNGQYVKIPGFIVPLEGSAELTTEFLLVPYFGACVHVPPPPSNQIVYVRFEKGIPLEDLYDAVWVVGKLSTSGWQGDIASVGYTMAGEAVEIFE